MNVGQALKKASEFEADGQKRKRCQKKHGKQSGREIDKFWFEQIMCVCCIEVD